MRVRSWLIFLLCLASACSDSGGAGGRAIAGSDAQREERSEAYLRTTLRAAEAWLEVARTTVWVNSGTGPQLCGYDGTATVEQGDSWLFTFDGCQQRSDAPAFSGSVRVQPGAGSGEVELFTTGLSMASDEGPVSLEGTVVLKAGSSTRELVLESRTPLTLRRQAQQTQLRDFTVTLLDVARGTELSMNGDVEDSQLGQHWSVSTPRTMEAVEVYGFNAPIADEGVLELGFGRAARLQVLFGQTDVEALWDLDGDGELEDGPYPLSLGLREAPGLFLPWNPGSYGDDGSGDGDSAGGDGDSWSGDGDGTVGDGDGTVGGDGDVAQPGFVVLSRSPEPGATGVDTTTSLVVQFSHPLSADAATSWGPITLRGQGEFSPTVALEFTYERDRIIAKPTTALEPATTYQVELDVFLEDSDGTRLEEPEKTWTFTTAEVGETLALSGKVHRLAYDSQSHTAYGLDAVNRKIARIDLASREVSYTSVIYVPHDACVDAERNRLFVVNKGSSFVTEYALPELSVVRHIAWTPAESNSGENTHYHIYCAKQRLYVVDAAWEPGLWTIDGLDDADPVAVNRSELVKGVGALTVSADEESFYYWKQSGWSAGNLNTAVVRVNASDFSQLDSTALGYESFSRDPLDAPVLLDASRGIVLNKNKVFDATNLSKLLFTLPGTVDTFDGASENSYALDPVRGRFASRHFIYSLDDYSQVGATATARADQMFFDRDGSLVYLLPADGKIVLQELTP